MKTKHENITVRTDRLDDRRNKKYGLIVKVVVMTEAACHLGGIVANNREQDTNAGVRLTVYGGADYGYRVDGGGSASFHWAIPSEKPSLIISGDDGIEASAPIIDWLEEQRIVGERDKLEEEDRANDVETAERMMDHLSSIALKAAQCAVQYDTRLAELDAEFVKEANSRMTALLDEDEFNIAGVPLTDRAVRAMHHHAGKFIYAPSKNPFGRSRNIITPENLEEK